MTETVIIFLVHLYCLSSYWYLASVWYDHTHLCLSSFQFVTAIFLLLTRYIYKIGDWIPEWQCVGGDKWHSAIQHAEIQKHFYFYPNSCL